METPLALEVIAQIRECGDQLRLVRLRRAILHKYTECENRRVVLKVLDERAHALRSATP